VLFGAVPAGTVLGMLGPNGAGQTTVRRLDAAGVTTDGLAVRRPLLDDVFLALTGHAAEEDSAAPGRRRHGRRGASQAGADSAVKDGS